MNMVNLWFGLTGIANFLKIDLWDDLVTVWFNILQVIVMQEKLEEKDVEIQSLKQELRQRSSTEEKTDSPSNRKTSSEMITAEDDKWNKLEQIL